MECFGLEKGKKRQICEVLGLDLLISNSIDDAETSLLDINEEIWEYGIIYYKYKNKFLLTVSFVSLRSSDELRCCRRFSDTSLSGGPLCWLAVGCSMVRSAQIGVLSASCTVVPLRDLRIRM